MPMGGRLSSGRWFHDRGATNCVLDVAGLTEGRPRCALSLALKPATAGLRFLPLLASPSFLARQESLALAALHCVAAPLGCGPIASGPSTAIEVAVVAARETHGDDIMATIGTFTSTANGFTGTIKTLNLNVKARFERIDNPSDKGPHFRIFAAANVELGAAWQKVSKETERDYLSVKLDDPSFPAPIYATLIEVEGEEGLQLIWSRPNRD